MTKILTKFVYEVTKRGNTKKRDEYRLNSIKQATGITSDTEAVRFCLAYTIIRLEHALELWERRPKNDPAQD